MKSQNTFLTMILVFTACFTSVKANKKGSSTPAIVNEKLQFFQQTYQECWGSTNYKGCVDDVIQNERVEIARLWSVDVPAEAEGHQDLWRKAYYACAQVTDTGSDFESCVHEVLRSNNLNATRRYKRTKNGVQHLRGNV
jgi:hypothetical protein